MNRFIRFPELQERKGVPFSNVHLRRLEAAGQFPRRVKIGNGDGGSVARLESEIDAWIEERVKARDAEAELK